MDQRARDTAGTQFLFFIVDGISETPNASWYSIRCLRVGDPEKIAARVKPLLRY